MGEKEHKIIMDELKTQIADIIKTTVNGKIDKLTIKVDEALEVAKAAASTAYIASDGNRKMAKDTKDNIQILTETLDNYIKSDTDWKKQNEPYLKGLANLTGSAKIVVWLCVGLSSVAGAWVAIKSLLK